MKRYHYTECGLDNVFIEGVEFLHDDNGEETICIPAVNLLHQAIAKGVIDKPGAMSGKELRFLRTEMGLTQAELAQLLHRDAQSIARWEKEEVAIDGNADFAVRMLATERLGIETETTVEDMLRRTLPTARPREIIITRDEKNNYRPKAA